MDLTDFGAVLVDALVTDLRPAAESNMRDLCTLTLPSSSSTWDEVSGTYVDAPPVTLYTGQCRIRRLNQAERAALAGEAAYTLSAVIVSLPVEQSDDWISALVHVDYCELDPALTDREFRVAAPHSGSQQTARRLRCEEVARR